MTANCSITTLQHVTFDCKTEYCKMLLKRGANPNVRNM